MFFVIPKNVTSEVPITLLLPGFDGGWLRGVEVKRCQARHRVERDATDGRNGGAERIAWAALVETDRFQRAGARCCLIWQRRLIVSVSQLCGRGRPTFISVSRTTAMLFRSKWSWLLFGIVLQNALSEGVKVLSAHEAEGCCGRHHSMYPGTSSFRPWNPGSSPGTKILFFLRGLGVNSRAVRCVGSDTIHDAAGHVHGDIYMALGGRVMDIHGSLHRNGKSNDTLYVHCKLHGGSYNVDILGLWQCNVCFAMCCWPARRSCDRCGARRSDAHPAPAPWGGKIQRAFGT